MSPEQFQLTTSARLQEITGIAKSSWSLYFNGLRFMNERTLRRTAESLEMKPEELLSAINIRREKKVCEKA